MPTYDLDPVERFVAGTVGPPGQRAFYLQARGAQALVTVGLEKQQVLTLAERLADVVDQIAAADAAAVVAPGAPDVDPLETPFEEDFRVLAMSLQWDENTRVFTIECLDHDPDEDADQQPGAESSAEGEHHTLRVQLTPGQARAFADRCRSVVAAGRPPCPLCAGPLDPAGHICPRANGYRR